MSSVLGRNNDVFSHKYISHIIILNKVKNVHNKILWRCLNAFLSDTLCLFSSGITDIVINYAGTGLY